jgi:flagellar assembly protein FliH
MDSFHDLSSSRRDHMPLFADDFDLPAEAEAVPEPQVIPPSFSAADIAAARAEAWAEGHEAGSTEARAGLAADTHGLLDDIARLLREAGTAAADIADRSAESIARLLLDCLAAIVPALCARHGEAELLALIGAIRPALAREPSVTVRLNPRHIPALMRELDRLDPDLSERMQLVPVEAIAPGDLRVSWQDGAAIRDAAALWRQVHDVLEPEGLLTSASVPATIRETEHVD